MSMGTRKVPSLSIVFGVCVLCMCMVCASVGLECMCGVCRWVMYECQT